MQHERDVKDITVNVSTKAEQAHELNRKGPEATFTRTKHGRARLLRRCTSQSLLLNENQKDSDGGRNRQDTPISSRSSGLLFVRPLSSSAKKQGKPSLFPRPKSSLMDVTGTSKARHGSESDSGRLTRRGSSSSSSKPSVPTLVRRSSYFSLQSLRRSISLDSGTTRRLKKRASRAEEFNRSFKGMVTAIDEEEMEEKRQLVSL